MATLLGTLPSYFKSEVERHGDGPKPGLTALAEPRKSRNAPKAPASASSANLQATGRDAGSFPSREVSAAASSLPKDSPRGLIRAVELKKQAFFPRTVDPTACRAQPETPAPATPRHATRHHPPSLLEGAAASGTIPDSPGRMHAGVGSGSEWICSQSLSEPPPHICFDSPSSARYCSVLLSCTGYRGPPWLTERARVPGFSAP